MKNIKASDIERDFVNRHQPNGNHCTGCTEKSWDLPEGRTHQLGTVEHPDFPKETEDKVIGCEHCNKHLEKYKCPCICHKETKKVERCEEKIANLYKSTECECWRTTNHTYITPCFPKECPCPCHKVKPEGVGEWETLKDTINKSIDWREWKQEINWERIEKAVKSLLLQEKAKWKQEIISIAQDRYISRAYTLGFNEFYEKVISLIDKL